MFVGHKSIVDRFEKQLPDSIRSHAFLFSGIEHVGKRMFAEIFAQAYIQGLRSLDLEQVRGRDLSGDSILLEPETVERRGVRKQKSIPVEDIRKSITKLLLSSRSGGRRVLIIDDAHMLGAASQNALLKTIEEPTQGRIIFLITHEAGRMLPTIHSRCEKVSFGAVSEDAYEGLFPEDSRESRLKLHLASCGCPGLVVRMKHDPEYAKKVREDMDTFSKIPSLGSKERLDLGWRLSADVSGAIDTIRIWIQLARNRAFLDEISVVSAMRNAERLDQTVRLLRHTNANARLLLENICLVLE